LILFELPFLTSLFTFYFISALFKLIKNVFGNTLLKAVMYYAL